MLLALGKTIKENLKIDDVKIKKLGVWLLLTSGVTGA